jgi:hypothetical protein
MMDDKAFEILYMVADVIRSTTTVKECTVESDTYSGEVIFTLKNGESYMLKLTSVE